MGVSVLKCFGAQVGFSVGVLVRFAFTFVAFWVKLVVGRFEGIMKSGVDVKDFFSLPTAVPEFPFMSFGAWSRVVPHYGSGLHNVSPGEAEGYVEDFEELVVGLKRLGLFEFVEFQGVNRSDSDVREWYKGNKYASADKHLPDTHVDVLLKSRVDAVKNFAGLNLYSDNLYAVKLWEEPIPHDYSGENRLRLFSFDKSTGGILHADEVINHLYPSSVLSVSALLVGKQGYLDEYSRKQMLIHDGPSGSTKVETFLEMLRVLKNRSVSSLEHYGVELSESNIWHHFEFSVLVNGQSYMWETLQDLYGDLSSVSAGVGDSSMLHTVAFIVEDFTPELLFIFYLMGFKPSSVGEVKALMQIRDDVPFDWFVNSLKVPVG